MSLLLKEELWKRFMEAEAGTVQFQRMIDEVQTGKTDPYNAVDELLENITLSGRKPGRKREIKGSRVQAGKKDSRWNP
jgi:hypothetical protein